MTDHGHFVLINVYVPNAGGKPARPRLATKLDFLRLLKAKADALQEEGREVMSQLANPVKPVLLLGAGMPLRTPLHVTFEVRLIEDVDTLQRALGHAFGVASWMSCASMVAHWMTMCAGHHCGRPECCSDAEGLPLPHQAREVLQRRGAGAAVGPHVQACFRSMATRSVATQDMHICQIMPNNAPVLCPPKTCIPASLMLSRRRFCPHSNQLRKSGLCPLSSWGHSQAACGATRGVSVPAPEAYTLVTVDITLLKVHGCVAAAAPGRGQPVHGVG